MTNHNRRNFLVSAATLSLAGVFGTVPVISFAARGSGMTITIGGREIEIIIPFFPEIPPTSDTIKIGMDMRSGGKSMSRSARVNAQAFMKFAKVLENGGAVNYRVGRRQLQGKFENAGEGVVNGTIQTPGEDEGELTSYAIHAGAAVAIVAIVAVVAVVAILSNTGGSVEAEADTPLGSASVDVKVGDGGKD